MSGSSAHATLEKRQSVFVSSPHQSSFSCLPRQLPPPPPPLPSSNESFLPKSPFFFCVYVNVRTHNASMYVCLNSFSMYVCVNVLLHSTIFSVHTHKFFPFTHMRSTKHAAVQIMKGDIMRKYSFVFLALRMYSLLTPNTSPNTHRIEPPLGRGDQAAPLSASWCYYTTRGACGPCRFDGSPSAHAALE